MSAPDTRRTVLLTLAVFGLQPIVFGTWLALIPAVQAKLGLDKAELALALLGQPAALVVTLQVASRLIPRIGPRRLLALFFPLQTLALVLPLLAGGQGQLFAALAVFGVAMAFLQVCLNVYAGRLEKALGLSVMNRAHGLWALGLMAGPICAAVLGSIGMGGVATILVVGALTALAGSAAALALPHLGALPGAPSPPRRGVFALPPALLAISIFALSVSMLEGAMSDWAAIYLAERMGEGARLAGLGVSVYAGCLAAGRLAGDAARGWLGPVALARGSVGVAIIGLLCLVLPLPLWAAFAGFALIGLGASVGFPLGVSAAAALDDRYEAPNIAIMSTVAISGFLIGPPLIGFLAEAYGLRVGLAALLPGLALSILLAGALRGRVSAASRPAESPSTT